MKTAEDYIKKYGNKNLLIGYSSLVKILTEHDQEIIKVIDEMEMDEMPDIGFTEWELMAKGYDIALKELRSKL